MVFDFIFVGGGLSAALSVLALHARKPEASIALIERLPELGSGHTWCFHARDVPADAAPWLEPLVVKRWPGYSVSFPRRTRRIASPYACISGAQLHRVLSERCAAHAKTSLRLSCAVREIGAHAALLEDGSRLEGALVIDARGPSLTPVASGSGYQKFLGLELRVAPGHALNEPLLIDANVPQHDGFRFMYALPLSAERVLLEDTYFSESPALDEAAIAQHILGYAARLGLSVRGVVRRERGILPMPGRGALPSVAHSPVVAGYRGGYFHPVTGYSFPLALRFADALSRTDPRQLAGSALARLAQSHAAQLRFLFRLTRMMFGWYPPEQRFAALEHFYRLPEPLIERFYAAQLSGLDRARVFFGPAPKGISLRRAFEFEMGRSA